MTTSKALPPSSNPDEVAPPPATKRALLDKAMLPLWSLVFPFAGLLAILHGSSFRLLRFGHLTHHSYNRFLRDRPDSFDPARRTRARALSGRRC